MQGPDPRPTTTHGVWSAPVAKKRRPDSATGDLFSPRPEAESELLPIPEAISEVPAGSDVASFLPEVAPPVVPERRVLASPSLYYDSPYREFEHSGGIHLVDSILWCDSDRKQDLAFISHAHADYVGKNRRILATDKTVKILTRGTGRIEALTSPYKRSFTLGTLELEMHPAGHVLGSAQLLIVRNGRRLVYTSDPCTRNTATAETGAPVPCDVLVVPATYGLPHYRFPPHEEVFAQIRKFIDDCLEDRATPVLIANQIGTSQELMVVLGKAGYRLRVHRSIFDVAKVYRDLGVAMPNSRRFQGSPAKDEVVLFPPILRKHASIRKLRKFKTALITGRAVDEGFVLRNRVEAAFPLSDCVDHAELLAFIEGTGASEIYLSDGYVQELSQELRDRGKRVYPLQAPKQLTLF